MNSKLTSDQVREIRDFWLLVTDEPLWSIAVMYGVSESTISNIKCGRTWRWVT